MPAKHERPIEQGQVGQVYAACYGVPKTGYQASKELDLPKNRPYEYKNDSHPELFEQREDNKLLSSVEPIIDVIMEDLPPETELSVENQETLRSFLEDDWRAAYNDSYDIEKEFSPGYRDENNHMILESGPYRVLQLTVGGWHYFINGEPNFYALTDTSRQFSKDYDLRPVMEVNTNDPYKSLYEAVENIPDELLEQLAMLPWAQQIKNVLRTVFNYMNFIPIRAVHEPNMIPAAGVELEPVDESDTK